MFHKNRSLMLIAGALNLSLIACGVATVETQKVKATENHVQGKQDSDGSQQDSGVTTEEVTTETSSDPTDATPLPNVPAVPGGIPTTASGDYVTKGCIDGDFNESVPDLSVQMDDLIANYSPSSASQFVLDGLKRRYPVGYHIVESMKDDTQCQNFLAQMGKGSTPDLIFLTIAVHECGHLLDGKLSQTSPIVGFYVNDSVTNSCTDRATMHRGDIQQDQWNAKRPKCASDDDASCDMYSSDYLNELGEQPFSGLMEELNQYANSVAAGYAFSDIDADTHRGNVKDGLLTFMWYMERYLQWSRNHAPDDYEALVSDPCWQKQILSAWGRDWLYLTQTNGMDKLEISAPDIMQLVKEPSLLDEINLVRKRTGCVK